MSVSTFLQPDATSQTVAAYSPTIDGDIAVFTRIADAFAPHEQAIPDMTVALDAGHLMVGTDLIEVPPQTSPAIAAPGANPRIDRVVVDGLTGLVSVVTGTEASSPVAPDIPAGAVPIAQVLLQTMSSAITNAMLTDERDFSALGSRGNSGPNVQIFTASGTYSSTAGITKIVVEVSGGGGSGGGCGATSSSQGAAAGGGGAGAYAKGLLTSGFSGGIAVTVGAGGAAPAAGANAGNDGGASSFGSLIAAPGGKGGYAGTAYTPPAVNGGCPTQSVATGGNLINAAGGAGAPGFVLGSTVVIGGIGGQSFFGGGGQGSGNAAGHSAASSGAGGGGASAIRSGSAASGGAGGNGIVIVYEYF